MLKEYFRLRLTDPKVRIFLAVLVIYGLAGCLWPGFLHSTDSFPKEDLALSNINNFFNPVTFTFLFGFLLLLLTREPIEYFSNISVLARMKSYKKSWGELATVLFLESFVFVLLTYFLMLLRMLWFRQASSLSHYWSGLLSCIILQMFGCFTWMFLRACISVLSRNQAAGFCATFLAMLIDYVAQTRFLQTFTISFIDVSPGKTAAFGFPLVFLLIVLLLAFQLVGYLLECRDNLPREVK